MFPLLDFFSSLAGFGGGLGLLALFVSLKFTRRQRLRYPILRSLDGKQPQIIAIAVVLWVVSLGLYGWKTYLLSRVSIDPRLAIFDAPTTGDTRIFAVRNNSDDDAYEVSVYFRLQPDSVAASDFSLFSPDVKPAPVSGGDPAMSDTAGSFCRDEQGHPMMMVGIYRLAGHEVRVLRMTRQRLRRIETRTEIAFFTRLADAAIGRNRTTSIPFRTVETLHCQTIGVFVAPPS